MNTPQISHTPRRAAVRPLEHTPGVRTPAPTPVGSEDVTVPRPLTRHAAPALRLKHLLAGMVIASVVGCGTTSGDRMASGAGIGAGAGAVLGAVTGMGPGTGAAIGAAAGAATGGLTNKKQVNLGKPVWR